MVMLAAGAGWTGQLLQTSAVLPQCSQAMALVVRPACVQASWARREAVDQLRLSLEEQYYADRPAVADSQDEEVEEASSSASTTTAGSLPSSFSKAFWGAQRWSLCLAGPPACLPVCCMCHLAGC